MKSLWMFLLALPFVLVGSAAWAEPPPVFMGVWGSEGTLLGEFQRPTGVAFDSEGHIVVVDSHNARIQLFQTNGIPVEVLRRVGMDEPCMLHPQDVGVDAAGRILVTDATADAVWVFDRGGMPLGRWGSTGSAPGQFSVPSAISANPYGAIFVADLENKRIQRLDSNGTCNFEWLPAVTGSFSVACDGMGHVFVADAGGNRVLKYDCSGNLLATWGERGRGPGNFMGPQCIATDRRGNVYVADTYNYRIQKFSGNGRFLTMWGSFGHGNGQFVKPAAIAINDDGLIAVADELINRVQVFGTPAMVTAHMDILPGVCPNQIAAGAGGTMQVALLGTATFDALEVDGTTARLVGLAPTLLGLGDMSQPPADLMDPCACTTAGPDGYDDLILAFAVDAVRTALGTATEVELTGSMRDGTPFTARGCLEMLEYDPLLVKREHIAIRLEPRAAGVGVAFTLPADASTRLTVHDVSGRLVGRLVDGWCTGGDHRIEWQPADLKSGVYFFRLEGGEKVVVKRVAVTR